MRICILSDFQRTGGAAVAADRLGHAFHRQGHKVHRIASDNNPHPSLLCEHTLFLGRKYLLLQNLCALAGKPHWVEGARIKELANQLNLLLRTIRPDVINLHNLHGAAWPHELVETARHHAPVTWTLHDCWSFLGAYYPSHSPQPCPSTLRKTNMFWHRNKNNAFRHSLAAVTPSRWMAEQALGSHWKNHVVEPIANTHPIDLFCPLPKQAAKETLGFSAETPLVLLAAGDLSEERKGGTHLADIFETAKNGFFKFCTVGRIGNKNALPKNIHHIGFVSDEKLMAILYAAADLLLHPAPIDNLPNTVAEASCCDLPTLAFAVGGLPEMIHEEHSGWLVPTLDPEELSECMTNILQHKKYNQLKQKTRAFATSRYSEHTVASAYLRLFEKLQAIPHS